MRSLRLVVDIYVVMKVAMSVAIAALSLSHGVAWSAGTAGQPEQGNVSPNPDSRLVVRIHPADVEPWKSWSPAQQLTLTQAVARRFNSETGLAVDALWCAGDSVDELRCQSSAGVYRYLRIDMLAPKSGASQSGFSWTTGGGRHHHSGEDGEATMLVTECSGTLAGARSRSARSVEQAVDSQMLARHDAQTDENLARYLYQACSDEPAVSGTGEPTAGIASGEGAGSGEDAGSGESAPGKAQLTGSIGGSEAAMEYEFGNAGQNR